jgi:hypothetical protein
MCVEPFRLVLFSVALAIFWAGVEGPGVYCTFINGWDSVLQIVRSYEVDAGEGSYHRHEYIHAVAVG